MVLAQAAGTMFLLGVLSGTARADAADSSVVEAQDQLDSSRDVFAGSPGQVVQAGARIDRARATVDVSVAESRASVAVDETGISLSLGTHVPERVDETPAHGGPHAPSTTVAGGRPNPHPSSDGVDRPATSIPWYSIGAAAGQHQGAATSSRHPLGRQLHGLAAAAGAPATSSEDRPDVLGVLARLSVPHDSAPRAIRSVIPVFTSNPLASTGPPG